MTEESHLIPDWEVPINIKALVTTRLGGYSQKPWDGFNLALHVNDNPEHVQKNRLLLGQQLPSEPVWLEQVHSNKVIDLSSRTQDDSSPIADGSIPTADGSYSDRNKQICVVMTADCLPILMTTRQGNVVMALHAGWRGLANGIIEQGVTTILSKYSRTPKDILVWLGPAIGPEAFEVGDEVLETFQNFMPCQEAFIPVTGHKDKWLADIYKLARLRLTKLGIEQVSGGEFCTYHDSQRFYSYRRDGITGRMASLIWIDS